MQLRFSANSPYVRKVRVVAHELGVSDRIELVPTALRVRDAAFWSENPLGKIPVLTTQEGASYCDSSVICEYLDARFGANRLLAANGPARWRALTTMALADGVTAAGILARQESLRPQEHRSTEQIEFQMAKVFRGLDRLQHDVATPSGDAGAGFDMPGIATACALGWLLLRYDADTVFGGREALSSWYQYVGARPSMLLTVPDFHA